VPEVTNYTYYECTPKYRAKDTGNKYPTKVILAASSIL